MIRFLTLVEREVYRFGRMTSQTIAPAVIITTLFILIFGYSLGQGIQEVSGFPYIHYILPGLVGMAVINNAYSNSSTSLFMTKIDRSIEGILVAPVSSLQVVTSFVIGGVLRGLVVGGVTLVVGALLTKLGVQNLLLVGCFLVATSVIFSSLGVIAALWARSWDHLATISTFVITPFVYLGGVFYSLQMLPKRWQQVSLGNPMLYLIDGFRFAILGISDIPLSVSLIVSLVLAVGCLGIATWLFKRGYRLIA